MPSGLGRPVSLCVLMAFALSAGGCATNYPAATTAGYGYAGGSAGYAAESRSGGYGDYSGNDYYDYEPPQQRATPENARAEGRRVVAVSSRYRTGEIIVSFADRRLYYIDTPGRALSYPITIPREEDRWQGVTEVSAKRENPAWFPTEDMLRENPRLPSYVPGGHPMNPLGVRALYLGTSTYRIHGTDAPWTIGASVSKGCIRMFNEHALDLYDRVDLGARVTVTWDSMGVS